MPYRLWKWSCGSAVVTNSNEEPQSNALPRITLRYPLRKKPSHCHPEEAMPVLSETKEGPLYLHENPNAGVLRFAQNDSAYEFFRLGSEQIRPV
jgi:hypothetical protein